MRDGILIEVLRGRDPIGSLHRRALAGRGADLMKLAVAWQPLYQILKPDQKRRIAFLTIFILREMGNAVEQHLLQPDEDVED